MTVKYPSVRVQLTGRDGNIFFIISRVRTALKKGGVGPEEVQAFTDEVQAAGSYDEALQTIMRWVDAR